MEENAECSCIPDNEVPKALCMPAYTHIKNIDFLDSKFPRNSFSFYKAKAVRDNKLLNYFQSIWCHGVVSISH